MNRRFFLKNTTLFAALAFLSKNSLAQLMTSGNLRMLSDDVGIFTEKGGTIAFLVTKEGIVVVDAQFPDTAPHFIEQVKEKFSNEFRYLINTHHHADHTAGNITFKGLVKDVAAHKNSIANQLTVAKKSGNENDILLPNVSFDNEGWKTDLGNSSIRTYYFGPAHTNGDSIVHFEKEQVAHIGDLCFNRKHPYIDKSAGASVSGWIQVLEKIQHTFHQKTQFICGHSGDGYDVLISHNDLAAYRHYLSNLLTFVEQGIKSGKTKEELIKTNIIPGSPEWTGEGINRPIEAAFEELSGR